MATYTENYNLEKPALDEIVDVNVINNNYDVIDEALGDAQELASNIGSAYNSIIAYNVGDYCIYNNNLYKCVQATSSGDSFNPAKWQICKVTDDLGNVVANPSGSATTSLTKLEVDGTIYGISGGGGGGSTVVVTPTLQSGTKVADIEVDNVTSTLYAPTPTEVEANPSGTGTATLSKLKVGSTTYNVSQGGGSTVTVSQTLSSGTEVAGIIVDGNETKLYAPTPTNVVANPSGQATTELDKLTVGSTIYKIPDDVEANPTATGTTDLNKLRVGSTTYNIPSGGGATTLNGLTDVNLNSSSNGQILKYDGTNQKWVNANESTGSTVVWNQITQTGTKIATVSIDGTPTDVYAPTSGGGSGGATSLAGLDDVTVSSVSNDQDLSYDSTSSKWINKTHRVELTKAEYDALPSSKLTDGIEYFITDMETTGTEIVANPQETATGGALTKLQVGDEIYSVGGSSSGGHTILDNNGTSLTQRDDLQFIGAYVNDDSTNEITKVNVVREMTKAQFDLLSNDEKVGLIRVTDEADCGNINAYGVFIDTSNVIYNETFRSSISYTATEDCYVKFYLQPSSNDTLLVNVDSANIIAYGAIGRYVGDILPIKKGQTISIAGADSNLDAVFQIFGIQSGSNVISKGRIDYSTNEQKTGQKWIDGKDIYQKTVTFTGSDINKGERGYVNVVGLPNNIERYISAEVNTYDDGAPSTFGGIIVISIDNVNNRALLYNSFITEKIVFTQNSYITVQYTKTT